MGAGRSRNRRPLSFCRSHAQYDDVGGWPCWCTELGALPGEIAKAQRPTSPITPPHYQPNTRFGAAIRAYLSDTVPCYRAEHPETTYCTNLPALLLPHRSPSYGCILSSLRAVLTSAHAIYQVMAGEGKIETRVNPSRSICSRICNRRARLRYGSASVALRPAS